MFVFAAIDSPWGRISKALAIMLNNYGIHTMIRTYRYN